MSSFLHSPHSAPSLTYAFVRIEFHFWIRKYQHSVNPELFDYKHSYMEEYRILLTCKDATFIAQTIRTMSREDSSQCRKCKFHCLMRGTPAILDIPSAIIPTHKLTHSQWLVLFYCYNIVLLYASGPHCLRHIFLHLTVLGKTSIMESLGIVTVEFDMLCFLTFGV